jgi:hypothetical protein
MNTQTPMSLTEMLSRQVLAFHDAIVSSCDRAAQPQCSDGMALRLRNNALALARVQLTMMSLTQAAACEPQTAQPQPDYNQPEPEPIGQPVRPDPDRILTGDALSRFVSRRLEPGECEHDIWRQSLHDAEAARRTRNPALPRPGWD